MKDPNGVSPIYLKITVDGKIAEISTKRSVLNSKWDVKGQRAKGSAEESKNLNFYLNTFKEKIYKTYQNLLMNGESVDTISLKDSLLGRSEKIKTIVPIFEEHNTKFKSLVGIDYAPGTLQRYETTLKHLKDFVKKEFNKEDFDIAKVDHSFIVNFEYYLRTTRKCGNNAAVKYVKYFGKIIRIALANGWLQKDPFVNYKSKVREVERVFLSEEELNIIINKQLDIERLDQVRDLFVFSCFTGLAYIDVAKLSPDNLCTGIDGKKWIFTHRQKTKTKSNIPLLKPAQEIIEKYVKNIHCEVKGTLLPILSNQKMNAYLKEIADLCGIKKELTFHTARHTFATTVTLSNDVPIESVSKMLGHSSIKITQYYAKVLDKKVSKDMDALQNRYLEKLPFCVDDDVRIEEKIIKKFVQSENV